MVYGIISQLDDVTTRELFRSKRMLEDNIIHINFIHELVKQLKSGDAVFVVSVSRFQTVSQFLQFGKFCMLHGVSLHLLSQPYLDLSSSKHWKPSVISQMMRMVEAERGAMARMSSVCKYTNEYWDFLCRTFEIMNLEVLAHIFSADGVLKRGS